jgi:hypothetical protein
MDVVKSEHNYSTSALFAEADTSLDCFGPIDISRVGD